MSLEWEKYREGEWDLEGLQTAVCDALTRVDVAPSDDRISALPDKRTLRYYRTLGLLDRPKRYDGRRAIYSGRHWLQVICIKLLQARGHSLAQLQRMLAGATTHQLMAAVREALENPAPETDEAEGLRSLMTVELQPGVLVTLDPRLVASPQTVLAKIAGALASGGEG